MTDSDQGAARRGFGRVAEQVSAVAQSAVDKVTPDSRQDRADEPRSGGGTGLRARSRSRPPVRARRPSGGPARRSCAWSRWTPGR